MKEGSDRLKPEDVDFVSVTEISGDEVSQEQVERICNRYYWAGSFCEGKDVVEAACGTGQGVGYLSSIAKSFEAGDFSEDVLAIARKHYGERFKFLRFDAMEMPFADKSKDVVVLFEALYYIPDALRFVKECARILRPGGSVLIATANKDLFDFNPSPYTCKYYGVAELKELFASAGFSCECFGNTPTDKISLRQKLLRPVKKIAVDFHLIPKSMTAKKLLKRFVFGKMKLMPPEIKAGDCEFATPTPLPAGKPDLVHKVIYCRATLNK